MPKKINIFISILSVFFFQRCSIINQRALNKDLVQLLAKHQIEDVQLECDMSNLSRSGKCVFKSNIGRKSLAKLIQELQLQNIREVVKQVEADEFLEAPQNLDFFHYFKWWRTYTSDRKTYVEQSHTCDSVGELENLEAIDIYGSIVPNSKVRVGNGAAFTEFLLYHRSDINDICIAVTYAYG